MAQRSSGYGHLVRVGAFRKVTASVPFGRIGRSRDRASEQRARIGGDAAFGRAPVGARTNGRTADGPWVVQQTDRPPIEYRSRDRQVACEKHLLEADGPDPGPRGLSSIGTRPHLSVAADPIVARPIIRPASPRKPIGLALQGGGSWGAYTWGVLDALLASRSITIAQLSGTSAGAINARRRRVRLRDWPSCGFTASDRRGSHCSTRATRASGIARGSSCCTPRALRRAGSSSPVTATTSALAQTSNVAG